MKKKYKIYVYLVKQKRTIINVFLLKLLSKHLQNRAKNKFWSTKHYDYCNFSKLLKDK